jgi:hypothetical protein
MSARSSERRSAVLLIRPPEQCGAVEGRFGLRGRAPQIAPGPCWSWEATRSLSEPDLAESARSTQREPEPSLGSDRNEVLDKLRGVLGTADPGGPRNRRSGGAIVTEAVDPEVEW